jgi:hypothetical protein
MTPPEMRGSLELRFQSELLGGEHLLWTGQPDPSVIFEGADVFLVPFSLLWGGFALFWEAGVLGMFRADHPVPWFMVLWGIPFVLAGLYFIVGRFFYKAWKKRRTFYALTGKRALVLIEGRTRTLRACFLSAVPAINKAVRPSGVGTITFGNTSWASMYENTGMDFFGSMAALGADSTVRFNDVRDADRVYGLAMAARKELPSG